jgi:hypothetical protein
MKVPQKTTPHYHKKPDAPQKTVMLLQVTFALCQGEIYSEQASGKRINMHRAGIFFTIFVLGCTTPAASPDSKKDDSIPPASSPTSKPMRLGEPTPQQAIITAKVWLSELRAKNTERITVQTGYPFYSNGLMPANNESCKGKDRAENKEAFAQTISCIFQNDILRENIPANLEARSVFEIKRTTLESAFKDEKELTSIHEKKKELTADCCRAYVQATFPGDKANVHFLIAIEWIKGDIRVVGVLSEVDPIE